MLSHPVFIHVNSRYKGKRSIKYYNHKSEKLPSLLRFCQGGIRTLLLRCFSQEPIKSICNVVVKKQNSCAQTTSVRYKLQRFQMLQLLRPVEHLSKILNKRYPAIVMESFMKVLFFPHIRIPID